MSHTVATEGAKGGPPDRLGPYLIRSRLGSGGMGQVFLARHETLDRLVALKLIRNDRSEEASYRARLLDEARAVARLAHPSIVGIHDVFDTELGPCVVMEFVPGRTLAQRIREEGPLALAEALAFGRDVAEGLAAAHARELVHRDLKSENVMITPGGQAVIIDFGLARSQVDSAGEAQAEDFVVGTPHTLSPEQLEGKADARSDLFALGVLLYEMLSGMSPFRGSDWKESLHKVREHQPAPLNQLRQEVPAGLSELVGRLLAKDPASRPADAAAVALALATFESNADDEAATASFLQPRSGISAPPATSPKADATQGQVEPAAKSRLFFAASILTLLLVVALAASFWQQEVPARRVLVLPPQLDAELAEGKLIASALVSASLAEVNSFGGLAAIDPGVLEEKGNSPLESMIAAAADEALLSEIIAEPAGSNIEVSLRRIDRSGRVLFSSSLAVPRKPVDLRWAAEAYSVALRSAFAEFENSSGAPRLDIESEDYAAFVRLLSATLEDGFATRDRLVELKALALRAPSFLPLQQMLGQMALRRYGDSREADDLETGLATARRCLELEPDNPQVLKLSFEAELAAGRIDSAEALLRRLEKLGGQGVLALHGRARLADHEGQPEEALALSRRLVELEPSWQNLYQLADREVRLGRIDEARQHLGEVLAMVPGNVRSKAKLAELELLYGDLAAAEKLFAELIAKKPRRSLLTNRGLALFLAGRLGEARESFEAALQLAPGHPAVSLNLADLLAAQGDQPGAAKLYGEVRKKLLAQRAAAPLSATDTMMLAQCLAHLGETREAVALTQGIHLDDPENSELAFQAAIVYSAAGDRTSALVAAEKALRGGVQPRWFALPWLGELRQEPELQKLLDR